MHIDPSLPYCRTAALTASALLENPIALSRGDPAASASCLSSLRVTVRSLAFVHSSPCLLMFLFVFLLSATPHFMVLSHCLVAEM